VPDQQREALLALATAGHDTHASQAYLGHCNIQHTVRYTELVLLAVADMAIRDRELEAARTARAVLTARADARAADLAPIIADVQAAGARSLRAIAAGLNARGVRTPRGVGEWSGKQVGRVLARLPRRPG
jgi:hypothetical protein